MTRTSDLRFWKASHPASAAPEDDGPTIPLQIITSLGRLSFLSATTIFGNPVDVALEEIALEMLYPADAGD